MIVITTLHKTEVRNPDGKKQTMEGDIRTQKQAELKMEKTLSLCHCTSSVALGSSFVSIDTHSI